jgi:cysteine synthase
VNAAVDPGRLRAADAVADREWTRAALRNIVQDFNRSSNTHLFKLPVSAQDGVSLSFKDESTHPTGSLKHRLASSLSLYPLCNGSIRQGTPVIEASSGSTAVSEAYFARMLGLPFVAVVPRSTSEDKVAAIRFHGGSCHFVEGAGQMLPEAERLAREMGGNFMDQFTYAERATDWRGNNNIAESIFQQMSLEASPVPSWIVVGAGTGGTSATIGHFIRYRDLVTRMCVADVEQSVFFDNFIAGRRDITAAAGSRIEGIGRPRCEPCRQPQHPPALPGAGRGVPVRRRSRAGIRRSRCAQRRRTARAAAHGHRPADEDAHAPGRAGRGDGADLAGRAGRRRGRSAHPAATAAGGHHLAHRLRAACRAEGLAAARRDGALWSGARASVFRHRRVQSARGRAGANARAQAAGAAVPLHHPPGAGRRESAAQCRRPGGTQTQDTLARRHHAPGDEAAGVPAAAGGTGDRRAPFMRPCRGPGCT